MYKDSLIFYSIETCILNFKCIQVYNKIDQVSMEEVDRLARQPNSVVIRYEISSGCIVKVTIY